MPLLALLVCSALVVGMAWFKQTSGRVLGGPFQPPEMAAAQFATRNMVGDLGGVPVAIPRHFANYVEYEGDPGFGEKRIGPRPERTHASKLTSFGFDVRFPDMAGVSRLILARTEAYASSGSLVAKIHFVYAWLRIVRV